MHNKQCYILHIPTETILYNFYTNSYISSKRRQEIFLEYLLQLPVSYAISLEIPFPMFKEEFEIIERN